MTADEFFTACEQHDWTYNFSDDHGVWRRGEDARRKLTAEMADDPLKQAIFKAWQGHIFSGPAFSSERQPRPVREDFVPKVSTFPGPVPTVNDNQTSLF